MALESGTRLGHYEITEPIGQGGMGEVYRARDTKLGRAVAIKVLPTEFAQDSERIARLDREARMLAALSHPNIAAIYGLEETDGTRFLVLELVEGDTLADRLKRGAIPIEESLKLALQIAEALEAAHERGVIHRDLKPANIKITPEGRVKVLDFGLAKSLGRRADPTMGSLETTGSLTREGTILGTPAYMSPEQVRGEAANEQSDVWAFGCVLFESLSGRPAFDGKTVSDIVAGILRANPDWNLVPANLHPRIRLLLKRCLERDFRNRYHTIADARADIDAVLRQSPDDWKPLEAVKRARRFWLWPSGAAALAAMIAWVVFIQLGGNVPIEGSNPLRFTVPEPEDVELTDLFAVSPDGMKLAFVGSSEAGFYLWVQDFETGNVQRLEETRTEINVAVPIWSPDGRFIAYRSSDGKLLKVDVSSGTVLEIADVPGTLTSGVWRPDGRIVFSYGGSNGLWWVSSNGGTPRRLTEGSHWFPSFLSDGRFLYTREFGDARGTVYAASLDAAPEEQSPREVMRGVDLAAYLPDPGGGTLGYLILLRDGTLSAERFDPDALESRGEPKVLATSVARNSQISQGAGVFFPPGFSISSRGLVYRTERRAMQLSWFDLDGQPVRTYEELNDYNTLSLSPDGKQLAAVRLVDSEPYHYDIWIHEMTGPERSTPLTSRSGPDIGPVWSPDGSRIAYQSARDRIDIYVRNPDGTGTADLLYAGHPDHPCGSPTSWYGQFILCGSNDIRLLSLEDEEARPFIATPDTEGFAEFSPDGRWVAYSSNKTGTMEIYVRAFDPSPEARTPDRPVSVGGGFMSHWARDSRRLFYTSFPDPVMMVVEITEGPDGNPVPGEPRRLFDAHPADLFWDVAGDLFIMPVQASAGDAAFRVVLDWAAILNEE